jgi:hypothetical protein
MSMSSQILVEIWGLTSYMNFSTPIGQHTLHIPVPYQNHDLFLVGSMDFTGIPRSIASYVCKNGTALTAQLEVISN